MSNTVHAGVHAEVVPWRGTLDATCHATWTHLAASASAFLQPEWCLAAGTAGVTAPWRVLLIRAGDRPIGLLPLRQRSPWSAEVLAPLSAIYPPVLVMPEAEAPFWHGVTAWFRATPGLGLLTLGPTPDKNRLAAFGDACRSQHLHAIIDEAACLEQLTLPASWDAYLAGLGGHARQNARRAESQLTHDFPGISITIHEDEREADAALDALIALYRLRWRHTSEGAINTFDDARHVAFYRKVVHVALRRGGLGLGLVSLEGQPIAAMTVFHTPGQTSGYAHFLGRDLAALPTRYSPSIALFNHFIRWLIARGATVLDLGTGSAGYKGLMGACETPQWSLTLARSPLSAGLLPRLHRGLHLIHRLPVQLQHRLSPAQR